ncbi:hypothetical protein PMIN02_005720 [Paraphaeosphaeria minitans]|uniref:Uncharacterized protein n=1 Tax=Paraphaeosphaeria minitans TaxID=565426 RepID=A0A9P6KLB5_9PLEO|nr:hypothetical protein PMIN01_11350 [Paraphaeosphaeria minitans]
MNDGFHASKSISLFTNTMSSSTSRTPSETAPRSYSPSDTASLTSTSSKPALLKQLLHKRSSEGSTAKQEKVKSKSRTSGGNSDISTVIESRSGLRRRCGRRCGSDTNPLADRIEYGRGSASWGQLGEMCLDCRLLQDGLFFVGFGVYLGRLGDLDAAIMGSEALVGTGASAKLCCMSCMGMGMGFWDPV